MDFGDYCKIEQNRFGCDNEIYIYKVIGRLKTNYYRPVPVNPHKIKVESGEMCEVVRAICCGVDETKVETFRVQDVIPVEKEKSIE